MFKRLESPEPDKILRVMQEFAADERPEKIDLGVGVYRTPEGQTPVFRAVKVAERRLVDTQQSKGYVNLAGDLAFHRTFGQLVLGDSVAPERIAALATPGGTGAVRQALELVKMARPGCRVWTPSPTWPNHVAILDTLRIPRSTYRYYDAQTGGLDRNGMREDIALASEGDLVLLHGCCHNPTGADLALSDWQDVTALLNTRGAVPMVDLAYQGFGVGVDDDVAGLRWLAAHVPEALFAVSASKNFGLYRDRVGLVLALCETAEMTSTVQGTLSGLNRQSYAFPPDHGARVVTDILTDSALRADWESELDGMRARVIAMRTDLAQALREETGSDRFGFLQDQNGLFSLLPASPNQVMQMRKDHALYVIGDGRINLAGLTPETVRPAARAIASVLG